MDPGFSISSSLFKLDHLKPYKTTTLAASKLKNDVVSPIGFLEQRNCSSKSQYVPDMNIPQKLDGLRKHTETENYMKLFDIKWNIDLHSQLGDDYEIANLGDLSELLDRLAIYDHFDKPLNMKIALMAINYFMDKIGPCEFVDEEEALKELNLDASLGYVSKRSNLFGRRDPQLYEYLNEYVRTSEQQPQKCIINASQKDELRLKKLVDGFAVLKTPRLFTAFPVEHTYSCIIALGDFVRQFYEHSFCKDGSISAVGDATQSGALAVYKYELGKRPYKYCTDTSGQDASVTREFMQLVYAKIKEKYNLTIEENNLFETVRGNSIDKYTNVNGVLYLLPTGLGSGDYMTVIVNIMWRLYMILENYKHPIENYFHDNTTIILGDDLIMSSQYADLELDSTYAKIEWLGRPGTWEEMDFCSTKFHPFIHHDAKKVLSVLDKRLKRTYQFSPEMQMQRLAGLLRVCSTREVHEEITRRMKELRDHHGLFVEYEQGHVSYETVYDSYNTPIRLY